MEVKQNNQKANRILYISVIAVLCAAAIIVAIAVAANRSGTKHPADTTGSNGGGTSTVAPDTTTPDSSGGDDPTVNEISFISPAVGSVLRGHSPDVLVFSPTMNDHRVHLGLDIATDAGAEVYATADGVIDEIWADPLMGQCISIEHDGGFVSYYRNLSETLPTGIEPGAAVKSGQLIGAVGETALIEVADEPHLHFELKLDGKQVDPLAYISEESRSASLTVSDETYEG